MDAPTDHATNEEIDLKGRATATTVSRRTFFRLSAAGVLTLYARNALGQAEAVASVVPGGTLSPRAIRKFVTPLLIPPAMPRTRRIKAQGRKNIDYYEIAVRQFTQQILPASLPPTTVWGYGSISPRKGTAIFNAPSLTIEAKHDRPVRVKWVNELTDSNGGYLPHLLPVDPTLHWANPPGGHRHRDHRPDFYETPGPYAGPVPIVTHLHGSTRVGDESDGNPEAWFLPDAADIPAGYAHEGTWYDFFEGKAATKYGVSWSPGSATCQYPNTQGARSLWYHDHALGMTRLNVYAGPAGFFMIRGGPGDRVKDTRTNRHAVLPGPAPSIGDPPETTYYEIPLAIQDRAFNADGSLFYPDSREFFDGIDGPYIPESDVSPIWNPEFFGNCMMVNGNTWPKARVEQRRYRFRLLNGCNSRFLILDFNEIPGVEVWQIGSDGGFLSTPVDLMASQRGRLLLGPAERADIIVDFSGVPTGRHVLKNVGPDEPFGGGEPDGDFDVADPRTTGKVMQFRVVPATAADPTTSPMFLQLPPVAAPAGGSVRRLALIEMMSTEFADAPVMAQLGVVKGNPHKGWATWSSREWGDDVTENPSGGATEVWEIYNTTGDAHPMHIHEVLFDVVNRQQILVDEQTQSVRIAPHTVPDPPELSESGLKDTVISYPGTVTRLRMTFGEEGQYVWHCHIVEHEDNEMMRPMRIGPAQPGQPI